MCQKVSQLVSGFQKARIKTYRQALLLCCMAVGCTVIMPATLMAQVPWSFTFESDSRLVSDALRGEDISTAGQGNLSEWAVVACDFNLDGLSDIVAARKDANDSVISPQQAGFILLNVDGKMTDVTRVKARDFLNNPSSVRDAKCCDMNGDGFPDCVVFNTFSENPQLYINRGNAPNGRWRGFRLATNWFTTAQGNNSFLSDTPSGISSCAGACADVDGDGDIDILISAYSWTSPINGNTTPPEDRMLINDGSGNFTEEPNRLQIPSVDRFHTNVQFLDVDGDGDVDYLTSAVLDNSIVAFNDGQGFFTTEQSIGLGGITYSGWVLPGITSTLDGVYSGNDDQDRTGVFLAGGTTAGTANPVFSRDTLANAGTVRPFYQFTNSTTISGVGVGTHGAFNASPFNFTLLENDFVSSGLPYLFDPDPTTLQNYQLKAVWDFEFLRINNDNKTDMILFTGNGVEVLIQD